MRINSYRTLMGVLVAIMIFTTACTQNEGQAGRQQNSQQTRPLDMNSEMPGNEPEQAVIQVRTNEGKQYVSLQELVDILEFNYEWDEETETYNMGDYDVVFKVKLNSVQIEKEEESIELSSAPIMLEGSTFIPKEAVSKLFQEEMNYEIRDSQLIINLSSSSADQTTEDELYFAEDPEDPFARDDEEDLSSDKDGITAASLKNININEMIRTAKNYLGVDYKFGAKSYAKSKRFDCSSFTQQIYDKYGINLRRSARKQANQGKFVSRKNLRKGDLLFFYVPGRFKSNKTVGHVGIYMGNKKMIHSSPEPKNGVQITDINEAYWKKTFLKAKRVVS